MSIDKTKHYFIEMHPTEKIPFIGWSYTSSATPTKLVECEIVEERYAIADNYKIELRSIEEGYGKETFYITDFCSLVKNGIIVEKTTEGQKPTFVEWYEPINNMAYLRHTAWMIMD